MHWAPTPTCVSPLRRGRADLLCIVQGRPLCLRRPCLQQFKVTACRTVGRRTSPCICDGSAFGGASLRGFAGLGQMWRSAWPVASRSHLQALRTSSWMCSIRAWASRRPPGGDGEEGRRAGRPPCAACVVQEQGVTHVGLIQGLMYCAQGSCTCNAGLQSDTDVRAQSKSVVPLPLVSLSPQWQRDPEHTGLSMKEV